MRDQTAVKYIK